MRLLVRNGGSIRMAGKSGVNLLHVAAQGDSPAAIVYLLHTQNQDVDQIDKEGLTALHHAARYGCELSIIYLVSYGAALDLVNCHG